MTDLSAVHRRLIRRETHSSRSGATVVVLLVLVLAAAYVGVEAVLAALGRRALLFSPLDVLRTLASASSTLVVAAGVATIVVGLILLVLALAPGRLGRHTLPDSRVAVVVDDRVVAASLARSARLAGALAPGQVSAWVSRRQARVTITPASGALADVETVLAATSDALAAVPYQPAISADVRVDRAGRIGA